MVALYYDTRFEPPQPKVATNWLKVAAVKGNVKAQSAVAHRLVTDALWPCVDLKRATEARNWLTWLMEQQPGADTPEMRENLAKLEGAVAGASGSGCVRRKQ